MRLRQLLDPLFEAPIEDFQTIGDFNRSSSFRRGIDRRLITNPSSVERVKNIFANTAFDFRLFFANSAEANRHSEVGEVNIGWLTENLPNTLKEIFFQSRAGFGQDAINVIFTNNKGTAWRPMTGWMMAHRMGHAILRTRTGYRDQGYVSATTFVILYRDLEKKVKAILRHYGQNVPRYKSRYNGNDPYAAPQPENIDAALVRRLLAQIGTFRSARDNNLRSSAEFIFECFAQYMLKGRITFNPAPQSIILGHAWGRPNSSYRISPEAQEAINELTAEWGDSLSNEFYRVLHEAVGKIYVM